MQPPRDAIAEDSGLSKPQKMSVKIRPGESKAGMKIFAAGDGMLGEIVVGGEGSLEVIRGDGGKMPGGIGGNCAGAGA